MAIDVYLKEEEVYDLLVLFCSWWRGRSLLGHSKV